MKKYVIISLVFSFFSILFYFYVINKSLHLDFFEKKSTNKKSHNDEKIKNKLLPIIDPSICKNNSEGYIYFQYGEEVFRFSNKSTIRVKNIFESYDRRLNRALNASNIAEGCEGNPYVGVNIEYEYKGSDPVKTIKFYRFGLIEVANEKYKEASSGQNYLEDRFYRVKNQYNSCENVAEGWTRCRYEKDLSGEKKYGQFISDNNYYSTAVGKPFSLECIPYVGNVLCESEYRLYPSVDIKYSYFANEVDPIDGLVFDRYIRSLFEDMRVKK